ncbi:hypothetical protein [Streptomyces sp. NPDC058548]|uniref:hypothetical protein n=1 Tax=unclassified Streptomyces TaxID=2593676 RepID=UPI00366285A6
MRVPTGATHRLLRTHNLRLALDHIRAHGPVSRAEFARASGLSKPTSSSLLEDLVGYGLVRGEERSQGIGRPAVYFSPAPEAATVLVVEVGPTAGRTVLAGFDGAVLTEEVRTDRASADPLADGRRWAAELLAAAGIAPGRVHRALLGVCGPATAGALLPGVPTQVLTDSQLAASAEYEHPHRGGGPVDHLAYVAVDDPLCVGLVLGGRLHRAARPAPPGTPPRSVEEAAVRLADSLAPIARSTGIETVTLGGTERLGGEAVVKLLDEELRQRLPEPPELTAAALGDRAVVTGGIRLALSGASEDLLDAIGTGPLHAGRR